MNVRFCSLALLGALVLAACDTTPTGPATAPASRAPAPGGALVQTAAGLSATFGTSSTWDSGFNGTITLTNGTASPVRGWTLTFKFNGNAKGASPWGAGGSMSTAGDGTVTVLPNTWGGDVIPAGGSVQVAYQGTGQFSGVSACTLNGGSCAGGTPAPSPTPTPTPTPPPPTTGLKYWTAPYILPGESTPDVSQVMAATGQKTFMLAFILAPNGGGCTPTWDGTRPLSTDAVMPPIIDAIRRNGGDISVSAGGYGGTKLGQTCPDAASTAAAYQQVIDKYKVRAMDFDLEEPEYENLAAINNEVGAIAILQRNNPGLYVSITIPGTASGTGYFGKNVLTTAKGAGVTNANFTIMPFDGGFNGAQSQTAALELFHQMLVDVFGWTSATAYQHEGVSMMNGRTDAGEHFYPADFQAVLDYAHGKGLGRYTFWSLGRDRACANNADVLSASCSGIAQSDWAFTKFTAAF